MTHGSLNAIWPSVADPEDLQMYAARFADRVSYAVHSAGMSAARQSGAWTAP